MKPLHIPYGRQYISKKDIKAVIDTLQSDYLTQGPQIFEFEKAFANYVGAKFAVAVSNGTAGLHLASLALGVSNNQKVIVPSITFSASANCIKYCGGDVVFADIDASNYLLDFNFVKKILEESPKGSYAGIVAVDFAGNAVNLEILRNIADHYGLWIIEDACHAPGGFFIDSKKTKQFCGNGKFAELAVFSFHPVKHITTGEGGMITTNDNELYKKLMELRSHGITRDPQKFVNDISWASGNTPDIPQQYPGWYMEMQHLGYNYRITDFQSALGLSQLKVADKNLQRRKEIAKKYEKDFTGKKWLQGQSGYVEGHAYHLYIIEITNRLGLYNYLRSRNIFAQVHYIPTHLMPYYKSNNNNDSLPNAETYYSRCLSLPMFATLTKKEQQYIIDEINNFFNG